MSTLSHAASKTMCGLSHRLAWGSNSCDLWGGGGVVLVPRIPEIVPGAPTFVPLFGHLGHNRPEHKRALGEGQWPTIYR